MSTSPPQRLTQMPLFDAAAPATRVVNVASVPQRSVFRYPGGKTWFVPTLRQWLAARADADTLFVEPFVGGGVLSLTAVCEGWVRAAVLVERDDDVAAVWQAMLSADADALAARVADFAMTPAALDAVLAAEATTTLARAFQTIVRNRANRGGILAPGAGRVKHGEDGRGVASRWYPHTLAARIRAIHAVRARLIFVHGDGLAALADYAARPNTLFMVDPPYTAGGKRAGQRLYRHHTLDHAALFACAAGVAGDVLMTYDDAPDVVALAQGAGLQTRLVPMKSSHHALQHERVVGKDLSWLGG